MWRVLEPILRTIGEAEITLNLNECLFNTNCDDPVLGHIWSPGSLKPRPERTSDIQRLACPLTVKAMLSVTASVQTLSGYIRNCATLLHPFNKVASAAKRITWSEE